MPKCQNDQMQHTAWGMLRDFREMLQRLGEVLDDFIRVPLLDAIAHAMPQMPFENHQPYAMQRAIRRVYLRQDVLARHILVYHLLDAVQLSDDPVQPHMQLFRPIYASPHFAYSFLTAAYYTPWGYAPSRGQSKKVRATAVEAIAKPIFSFNHCFIELDILHFTLDLAIRPFERGVINGKMKQCNVQCKMSNAMGKWTNSKIGFAIASVV